MVSRSRDAGPSVQTIFVRRIARVYQAEVNEPFLAYTLPVPTKDGRMQAREFLFYVEDLALAALSGEVPKPERKVMWTILQLSWGHPAAHIELQPQPSRSLLELGLHFEASAEENEAWAQRVASDSAKLQAGLGPEWELEEWTASWRRLHRVYRFEHLTGVLGREVAAELSKAIALLWPYALVGAPRPAVSAPRPTRDRYRDRYRRTAGPA